MTKNNLYCVSLFMIIFLSSFLLCMCHSEDPTHSSTDPIENPGDPAQNPEATALKIAWDANTESDLAGYRIYYGTEPGEYDETVEVAADVTSYSIEDLDPDTTYYISITAYDSAGNESAHSGEVSGVPR